MVHSFITVNNWLLWRSFDWPNCFTDISNHHLILTVTLSHIHCLILWGSCIKENHRLHLLQKKALKIIINSHHIVQSEPIFKAVRCLKLPTCFGS